MFNFSGKKVVITGGSGGIGAETARQFLEAGAEVLLVDINESDLAQTKNRLNSDRLHTYTADVSKSDQVQAFVQYAVDQMGGIDVFFNNAGIEGMVTSIVDYPEDMFHKVLAVNVLGVWYGLKYVMPVMKEKGGSIIITSSVAGQWGWANLSAYVTSKHAVVGLMRVAALEGAPNNIRVNSVHPGPVENRMMRSVEDQFSPGQGDQAKGQFEQMIPIGRYATNTDVANLVLFLSSPEGAYLNGGQFNVDGGMSAA